VASEDLTPAEYRALAEFRYSIRQFLHFSENVARSYGIESQQHQLLLAIKGLPAGVAPNIGELAARLHIRHHSAVELIDRLSVRGLIRRRQDRFDRRRVLMEITPQGESTLHKLSLIHRAQLETAGPDLIRSLQKLLQDNKERKGIHEDNRPRKDNLKRAR
jgi:DNA-binding MarR family transcriptional regulator